MTSENEDRIEAAGDLPARNCIATWTCTGTTFGDTRPDIIRLALPASGSLLVAKLAIGRASQCPCVQHSDIQARTRV